MSEEVRDDYLESLEELTVNSRPVIKTLTEIAQENVGDASAVVEAIDIHVRRCPPNHKLPPLYLVDSICKNKGEPYISLFTPRIVGIFANAFTVSPEPVRLKLNELFRTWTMPVQGTGQPLFSHEVLHELNAFLSRQQVSPLGAPLGPPSGLPAAPARPRLNQSGLMVEMNRLRQQLENDTRDSFNERQLSLLARLEAQTSGVVDPKALPQLQAELDDMKFAREQYLSRPPPTRRGNGNGPKRENRRQRDRDHRDRGRNGGGVDKITGTNNVPLGTRKNNRSLKPSQPEVEAMAQSALASTAPELKAAPGTESLDLASACEQPASPALIDQLYSKGLPLQCSTCGYRFRDTEEGRAAKQAEMDWHFRANKDIREGHSRNRSWFLMAVAWVSYRDEDEVFGLGSALSTGADVMNNKSNGGDFDDSAVVDLEKEKKKFTEVPLESNVVCPVCQEPHETSWSEEAENWVWMNTVEVEGHFFHATCFADPQNRQLVASVLDQKPE